MLRQSFSALRSTARLGTQRQTIALAQSYQTPFAAAQTIAPRSRWYSSETDAAKKNGEEAKNNGEAESPEAALKKQLEAKDAEVRDLKVSSSSDTNACTTPMLMRQPCRTATSAPSPTSATCKTATRAR
jgi:hypothetical protein